MSESFSYKDLEAIILEKLKNGGKVRISPKGTSMMPLIREGIDEVELTGLVKKPKKYDIIFYKRKTGEFILHRIIKVKKNSYILMGDNQITLEKGICDDMILAVVSGIYRDKKYVDISDKEYIKYSKNQVKKQMIKRKTDILKSVIRKIVRGR